MTAPAVPLDYPIDILASYYYFRTDESMAKLVRAGCWNTIGDSGAFSAWSLGGTVDLDEYAVWCRTWWDHLCWCASLDVIGDPIASHRNWTRLRDQHGLLTVPTVHAGTGTEWIDQYASEGVDLIGLGGLAGRGMGPRAYRWTIHTAKHVRDRWPNVRLHLWGMTSMRYLSAIPVWSADSSGVAINAYRYAIMRLFNPRRGKVDTVNLRGNEVYRHGPLLRQVYGVDPATIAKSSSLNRPLLARLSAASTREYAHWLQTRHKVTPPSMYRGSGGLVGPRIHLVDNDYVNLEPPGSTA